MKSELNSLLVYDLDKAIEKIRQSLSTTSNLAKVSLLHEAKYKRLIKEFNNDLISRQDYSIEHSKIIYSVISLIDEITEEDIIKEIKNMNHDVIEKFRLNTFNIGKLLRLRVNFKFNNKAYQISIGQNEKITEILYKIFVENPLDFPNIDNSKFHFPILKKNEKKLLNSFHIKDYDIQNDDEIEIETIEMTNIHEKFLLKTFTELSRLLRKSDKIFFDVKETRRGLPISYYIEYRVRSIVGIDDDYNPIYSDKHVLNAKLNAVSPFQISYHFESDIWHPNVKYDGRFKGRVQILSDSSFNTEISEPFPSISNLTSGVINIGKMLQYKIYSANQEPPFPEDLTVAKWVKGFAEKQKIVNKDESIFTDNSILIG